MKAKQFIAILTILLITLTKISFSQSLDTVIVKELKKGWNILGYSGTSPESISEAFSGIMNNIVTIKNFDGFYDPEQTDFFNSFDTINPSEALFVKVIEDCIFELTIKKSAILYVISSESNLEEILTNGNDGNNLQIKNIGDPTEPNDIATINYLETRKNEILTSIESLNERINALENINDTSEIFTLEDAPRGVGFSYNSGYFDLSTPWGYYKEENINRQYPIVVLGRHNESRFISEETRKKHPAFYLNFSKSNESDGVLLANIINNVIITEKNLRVDTNRIYLTGWSQGGSGGYNLMRGFYSKNMFFAGMIRIAGQSQTELPNDVVSKTSVWYHVGLNDTDTRIVIAETAYSFIKNHVHNINAIETTTIDTVTTSIDNVLYTYPRTTKTLTKNNIEIFKLSFYENMGHIVEPPYGDPTLFDWLFSQSILNRQ